jgi:hypothetical protein
MPSTFSIVFCEVEQRRDLDDAADGDTSSEPTSSSVAFFSRTCAFQEASHGRLLFGRNRDRARRGDRLRCGCGRATVARGCSHDQRAGR